MRSKLTLFIDKKIKTVAETLAKQKGISVSKMFEDFISSESMMNKKLKALEKVSGSMNVDPSDIHESDFRDHINKKHDWDNA